MLLGAILFHFIKFQLFHIHNINHQPKVFFISKSICLGLFPRRSSRSSVCRCWHMSVYDERRVGGFHLFFSVWLQHSHGISLSGRTETIQAHSWVCPSASAPCGERMLLLAHALALTSHTHTHVNFYHVLSKQHKETGGGLKPWYFSQSQSVIWCLVGAAGRLTSTCHLTDALNDLSRGDL